MQLPILSIRPFIGAKDFSVSRAFYKEAGFNEVVLSPGFSVFQQSNFSFYLQDFFAEEWINNTQVFLEVNDIENTWKHIETLDLPGKFKGVRLTPIKNFDWGREFYLHDPSGILWHFGSFNRQN